jgi:3-hydroxyisobutyrate dehydrogenase
MTPLSCVGFVGLGKMGRPMAARLSDARFELTVFDVRPDVVADFVRAHGGKPAARLRDLAARSHAIVTMLPNGRVVRHAVLGNGEDEGLLGAMAPGTVLIDMSSSSPTDTRELGGLLARHGVDMIDAPVSGGVGRAETGTLSIMAGGDSAVVARCRPLLESIGQRIFATGALGSGHALKALNNLVSAAGLIASAEALLIGRRFGLDPSIMIDVFNASTARNNSTENKLKQFVLSRSFASGFSLGLMVKDLTTAVELAHATGTPAPFSAGCRELWAAAQAELEEDADHTAVVQWLEKLARVRLEGEPEGNGKRTTGSGT